MIRGLENGGTVQWVKDQIRLDGGEWQVPPGLPSTQREFAGAAGVLLIEEAR
jgi:hypothetical protein